MNDSVLEVRGQDGKVKEVVLKSAKVLPADVFIVGIGEFTLRLVTTTFILLTVLNRSQIILAKLDVLTLYQNMPDPYHQSLLQWLFL